MLSARFTRGPQQSDVFPTASWRDWRNKQPLRSYRRASLKIESSAHTQHTYWTRNTIKLHVLLTLIGEKYIWHHTCWYRYLIYYLENTVPQFPPDVYGHIYFFEFRTWVLFIRTALFQSRNQIYLMIHMTYDYTFANWRFRESDLGDQTVIEQESDVQGL